MSWTESTGIQGVDLNPFFNLLFPPGTPAPPIEVPEGFKLVSRRVEEEGWDEEPEGSSWGYLVPEETWAMYLACERAFQMACDSVWRNSRRG